MNSLRIKYCSRSDLGIFLRSQCFPTTPSLFVNQTSSSFSTPSKKCCSTILPSSTSSSAMLDEVLMIDDGGDDFLVDGVGGGVGEGEGVAFSSSGSSSEFCFILAFLIVLERLFFSEAGEVEGETELDNRV